MKLISSHKRQELPAPYKAEIVATYGDAARFAQIFSVGRQAECEHRFLDAFKQEKYPVTLVRAIKTYGAPVVKALIGAHLTGALISMGAECKAMDEDIKLVSMNIANSRMARRMTMVSLLKFFHRLQCGEYRLYESAINPRRILEAFNEAAPGLIAEEQMAYQEATRERMKAEEEEHDRQLATPEERCANMRKLNEWCIANGHAPIFANIN